MCTQKFKNAGKIFSGLQTTKSYTIYVIHAMFDSCIKLHYWAHLGYVKDIAER